jgi:Zn-dependent protease
MKFAMIAAAPAVVLHELSHKFVAMSFGVPAVLYAPYGFYLLAIMLRAVGFPILFFVGGFVTHPAMPLYQYSLVAFAGPAINFLLWGFAVLAMKRKWIKRKYYDYALPFAKINLFLGIFNMIPLPGFDGWFIVDIIKAAF